MTSPHYTCPCGYTSEDLDDCVMHEPPPGSCCNCGGIKCMDCVLRAMHDECIDDCPRCCGEAL